ncbi:hypothetical protein BVRB_003430 [Beta vulgaris subsp. vulgaris]|uniref:Yippee domain-containing protein n=1 Tax=Beta vulgaris subsp. vulgaris TaxID=3555 RepID=A0A0J8B7P1_BETVV|nr:hypothetical protein BVRB_003430 [Beta vulgaris subsp. vulgaris]
MRRLFVVHLKGKIYSCKHCRTHLAISEDIVSKNKFVERIAGELTFFDIGNFNLPGI